MMTMMVGIELVMVMMMVGIELVIMMMMVGIELVMVMMKVGIELVILMEGFCLAGLGGCGKENKAAQTSSGLFP